MRLIGKLMALLLILMIISCSKKGPDSQNMKVFVSIAPQKFFVEKIGGDLVDVAVLVPPGSSPHSYEPRPSQMAGLSQARLFFTIGIDFEKAWVPRIKNSAKNLQIIPLDSGIEKIEATEHGHHDGGSDHDEGLDPHIWLSPELVKILSKKIMLSLSASDSVHKDTYLQNYKDFITEIDTLQSNIKAILTDCPRPFAFMVFHPAWGYFAREFNLQEIPIEIDGKEPSPKELAQIVSLAKEKNIKTIFIQPQFSSQSAQQIAHEIGAQTVIADDLAENWDKNLLHVAQLIGKCK